MLERAAALALPSLPKSHSDRPLTLCPGAGPPRAAGRGVPSSPWPLSQLGEPQVTAVPVLRVSPRREAAAAPAPGHPSVPSLPPSRPRACPGRSAGARGHPSSSLPHPHHAGAAAVGPQVSISVRAPSLNFGQGPPRPRTSKRHLPLASSRTAESNPKLEPAPLPHGGGSAVPPSGQTPAVTSTPPPRRPHPCGLRLHDTVS